MFLLLTMIFAHILADYTLQGWLANAKQRQWWKDNLPQQLYRHDYLMALFMHSFSWSFMIMLPLAYINEFQAGSGYIILFCINLLLHGVIDHLKANCHKINLIQDQYFHLIQIIVTFLILL